MVDSGVDIDRSDRSNEKLFKSRKSTILGNSGVIVESKFPNSSAKEAFNLLG